MAVVEKAERAYVTDSMGRTRRVCPTCDTSYFPGKTFQNAWFDCYYCRRERAGVKKCVHCGEEKALSEFPGARSKVWRCKPCNDEYQRQWRAENPRKVKNYYVKSQLGLDAEEWRPTFERTDACPICLDPLEDADKHIDHDHATGAFRGILCGTCNCGIGLLRDDMNLLRRAIEYLKGELS